MSAFYSEEAFFDAWRRAVALAGSRWFGDGKTAPENAGTKWDLAPRVEDITEAMGWLSSGEAMLLAAMVSLYNSNPGGQMLRERDAEGLSDIAASLDEPRRRVLADLLISYPGW
jgi:hypothetical protein